MLSRIWFTLRLCCKDWPKLCDYMRNPQLQLQTLIDLQRQDLINCGVKALVLDFDGVLAAHGELNPRPEIIDWLDNLKDFSVFVLSNKPTNDRRKYFQDNFSSIKFIVANRKKPYPDGTQEIIDVLKLPPEQIMLVDDRLATGILAAINAGMQARLVMNPYKNLAKRPIREIGFMILRWIEQNACKLTIFCSKCA